MSSTRVCRLADFIMANADLIVREWESAASGYWPDSGTRPSNFRPQVAELLLKVAVSLSSSGAGEGGPCGEAAPAAGGQSSSSSHYIPGGQLRESIAKYRALRSSVIRTWLRAVKFCEPAQLEEIHRFHEALDYQLAQCAGWYAATLDNSRSIFLSMLGHDLRTPLSAISMLNELQIDSGRLDPHSLKVASQISSAVSNMSQMITDLLDFTSVRLGGRLAVDPVETDLRTLCGQVLSEAGANHPDYPVQLECAGDVQGRWDPTRLRQLLMNLLANAKQQGRSGNAVYLFIDGTGAGVELVLRCPGLVIPEEALALVFEPVRRGSNPGYARSHASIGLGLYMAREVAVAHGGSIEVKTGREETSFVVRLPRTAPAVGRNS